MRTTPSGQPVCNFSIATNRTWTNPETKEKQEKAEFHNIVAWRRLAEIANQYLKKGSLVMIEGRIETRSWDDQSGNKKYRTEIVAENMQLGPRASGSDDSSYGASQGAQSTEEQGSADEIPTIESDEPTNSDTGSGSEDDDEINVKNIPF